MAIQKSYTIDELASAISAAISVIDEYRELPPEILSAKLNSKTWSCLEICRHLVRFNDLYLDQMKEALGGGESLPEKTGKLYPRWHMRKLAGQLEPPYKIGLKTVSPLSPSKADFPDKKIFAELIRTENDVLKILKKAQENSWDLDRIKNRNPVFKLFKMSMTEFIIYLDAHQRRHFWQMEQILKRLNR